MTRTNKLRESLKDGEGVIISGYANIFYYSGFTSEDAVLLITRNRQIIATDSRYTVQAREQASDFEQYDIAKGLFDIVQGLDCDTLGFEEDYVTVKQLAQFQKTGKKLVPMQNRISAPRRCKSDEEILRIRAAEELGDAAFSYLLTQLHTGMTEIEAAFILEMYMRKNGAQKTSFDTIVASGIRSAMPHGTASDKVIEKGDFVTMDFGCVLDGYCSDMTRTVVMGVCSERQREIYDTVLAAQTAALEAADVGKSCAEIDRAARSVIEKAGYGGNFGHSLGHSVGIEIHENPCFSPKSTDITEIGNVITVEPGIYIDGFGGVRIEDVIAIGENVQNLTKSCKELIII
ncbi:MAG: aminopeptidase P family protein [Clostridiales bacterium]|nr:aminopeptidase P family protein [Clostridiales bacterium]